MMHRLAPALALLAVLLALCAAPPVFGTHVMAQGRAGRLTTRWVWGLALACAGAVALAALSLALLLV